MPKSQRLRLEPAHFTDPETGVRIMRLTPPDVLCHRNYFYQKCFTNNGRHLLFGARFDTHDNHWLLDLTTGEARQLTEGAGCNTHGALLSADDSAMFYVRGGQELRRVDLASLEETVLFRVPEGWRGQGTWVPSSDERFFAGMLQWDADVVRDASGWERFRRQFEAPPRSRLIAIDLARGTAQTVFEERRYLGHPSFRPQHADTMGFCHEGPHDRVAARMWLIQRDGRRLRCVPQAAGEACMHEFWAPDGSTLFHVRYQPGEAARQLCSTDPDTLETRVRLNIPACAHLMSNADGSRLVGDGAGGQPDLADAGAHAFAPDPWLYLFDLASGDTQRICRHGTSWAEYHGNAQVSHPHPSFTPDEQRVLFTSDQHGLPALYLAELPRA